MELIDDIPIQPKSIETTHYLQHAKIIIISL